MCKGRDQQMRADENGNLLAEVKGREGNSFDGVSTTHVNGLSEWLSYGTIILIRVLGCWMLQSFQNVAEEQGDRG